MYWKYLWYVIRHKWYVFVECCKFGIPWHGLIHDLHKLLPCEFIPYAKYFYGSENKRDKEGNYKPPPTNKIGFDRAWNHHQKHPLGSHHWQYHVLVNDDDGTHALKMPFYDVLEMYCDWVGAGKAITGRDNTKEWYKSRKEKIVLHDATRGYLENLVWFGRSSFKRMFRKEYERL